MNSLTSNPDEKQLEKAEEPCFSHAYHINKALHDCEVPDTVDPKRLAQAASATAFLNDPDMPSSPFDWMSDYALSDLARDGSGAYTVNERRAAQLTLNERLVARMHAVQDKYALSARGRRHAQHSAGLGAWARLVRQINAEPKANTAGNRSLDLAPRGVKSGATSGVGQFDEHGLALQEQLNAVLTRPENAK